MAIVRPGMPPQPDSAFILRGAIATIVRAMVLQAPHEPLRGSDLPTPHPLEPHQLLLKVRACGVCRTDLHIVDGELPRPKLPLVPGHEIVGSVIAVGSAVQRLQRGDRVGVPWLGWTCGSCSYCGSGRENLCDRGRFTGYDIDGGYAQEAVADERYALRIPSEFGDAEAAPLLCAGLIGFRALRMAGEVERIGFYGFGAAAHIAVQLARHRGQRVYAFTRPGDLHGQDFARNLGASWAGSSEETPPEPLQAALIFAPVGSLVPTALQSTTKGGTVVCAGIHMSDIPRFPYDILWGERVLRSVANLTRKDGDDFFDIATKARVRTVTTEFRLEEANDALDRLRSGKLEGAAVLIP